MLDYVLSTGYTTQSLHGSMTPVALGKACSAGMGIAVMIGMANITDHPYNHPYVISTRNEGAAFGVRGRVSYHGRLLKETRLFPHGFDSQALRAAENLAGAIWALYSGHSWRARKDADK
jgi:hypothetical protein